MTIDFDILKYRVWHIGQGRYVFTVNTPSSGIYLGIDGSVCEVVEKGSDNVKYIYLNDEIIIERSTGKKDKYGNLIYEGDKVKSLSDDEIFTVEWNKQTASFVLTGEVTSSNFDFFYDIDLEVVGNIHEPMPVEDE